MATRSPTQTHSYWGNYATGSLPASSNVQVGDTAYDTTQSTLVVCISLAPVVWGAVGSGPVPASGVIDLALNGSAANLSPTFVGAVYIPSTRTLAATSRAWIGVSGANQSVKLELLNTAAVVKATFQNLSATGFVDATITTPAQVLAAGWYDILLTANTSGSTAFARGLYLTV